MVKLFRSPKLEICQYSINGFCNKVGIGMFCGVVDGNKVEYSDGNAIGEIDGVLVDSKGGIGDEAECGKPAQAEGDPIHWNDFAPETSTSTLTQLL